MPPRRAGAGLARGRGLQGFSAGCRLPVGSAAGSRYHGGTCRCKGCPVPLTCSLLDPLDPAVCEAIAPADLPRHLAGGNRVIWVDIEAPTMADIDFLAETFHFHPLALEDCSHAHQRPKVDAYDGYVFLVLYNAHYLRAPRALRLIEMNMFWGERYVVTVHAEAIDDLDEALGRWQGAGHFTRQGTGFFAYLLIDSVVDNYFPVTEAISEEIDEIEEELFGAFDDAAIRRIFTLKKSLIQLRKVVVPLRDTFLLISRRESGLFAPQTLPYLQDVYDHLIRVSDTIDTYRDLIASTIDAYLSTVANRTNAVMKRLTTLSTVIMTPTLLAGIWGMNFEFMPELHNAVGYPAALALMLAIVLVELLIFRRLGYF